MDFYDIFKSIAFKLDAEKAHELSLHALSKYPAFFLKLIECQYSSNTLSNSKYALKIQGMTWPFPIGLAAGLDKNGVAIDFFAGLLFGGIEVGTVTPKAQAGNPKPRMFRYPKEQSLRNCMGFNNGGADVLTDQIKKSKRQGKILGVNIGKNKLTENCDAQKDYCLLYEKFAPLCDYLVINISSPNTPGLRDLQAKDALKLILESLSDIRRKRPCPLFVKVSPDSSLNEICGIIELILEYKLAGIIATNTTSIPERGSGGMSGRILHEKARNLRHFILNETKNHPSFELIGVGGISSFDDLWEFWQHGGKIAQIYTSFIYQGPKMLFDIATRIDLALERHKVQTLEELIKSIKHNLV